jgi:hypothetical protein
MEEAQPRTPREKAGERSCGGRRQSSGRGDILHSRINRETNWIEGDGTEEGISDARLREISIASKQIHNRHNRRSRGAWRDDKKTTPSSI